MVLDKVVRVGFNMPTASLASDSARESPPAVFAEVLHINGKRLVWKPDEDVENVFGATTSSSQSLQWSFNVTGRKGAVPQWSEYSQKRTAGSNRIDDQSHILGHKDTIIPDHTDRETVLNLGLMAFNAYYEPDSAEWLPIDGWLPKDGFGSTKSAIRGHIYKALDPRLKIITVVIKGTSLQTPFQGGKTGANDKLNDNLMFSCCCGKAGWSWRAVDGCACANSAATECKSDAAMDMYPLSTVWTTGHSLGGSLASLVALTFDLPAFTFEPPGDFQFAKRIGLLPPAPPSFQSTSTSLDIQFTTSPRKIDSGNENWDDFLETLEIYQFGNDGDPIYLGTCMSGIYSSCWLGGYAIETKCHLGKECVYNMDKDGKKPGGGAGGLNSDKSLVLQNQEKEDTEIGSLAKESINNHGIQFVLDSFLRKWEYVPECKVRRACVDCETWSWLP
ncbi:UNVERIFIED_CONTAM: putative lipase atg15 [Siphonaria sp. JEL0065]|nr:putative lipase atg15 [Siphonaria sp. JEL0065]